MEKVDGFEQITSTTKLELKSQVAILTKTLGFLLDRSRLVAKKTAQNRFKEIEK